jgi:phage terminase small subunit
LARKGSETELSEQELQFCINYLDPKFGFNATQAAIAAGYSPKTAAQQASRLLTRVKVRNWLTERVEKRIASADSKAEKVIQELERRAYFDPGEVMSVKSVAITVEPDEDDEEWDGSPLDQPTTHITDVRFVDWEKLTPEQRRHFAGVKVDAKGNLSVRFRDSDSALQALAKHHGLLRERVELEPSDDLMKLLDQRRDRARGRKAGERETEPRPRASRPRRQRPQRR